MYFMVDNYDSFVYNLSAYMRELGQEVLVRRADAVSLAEIRRLRPEGIILSPGPKRPSDAVEAKSVLREFQNQIPILGVCLGHQVLGQVYGANVCKGERPMHGKITKLCNDGTGLFAGLPAEYEVTRYHSLVVSEKRFPACLRVTARSADGVVMGLAHRTMPIYGVQFHPEAVLTQHGRELLGNFCGICRRYEQGIWRPEPSQPLGWSGEAHFAEALSCENGYGREGF